MQCDNEPTVQRNKEINYTRDKEIKVNICQSKAKRRTAEQILDRL